MRFLYILGEFPSKTEHFISNEIEELQKNGVIIDIISLNKPSQISTLPNVIYENKAKAWFLFLRQLLFTPNLLIQSYINLCKISSKEFLKKCNDLKTIIYFSKKININQYNRIHSHFANRPTDIGYILAEIHIKPFSFTAHADDIYCSNPFEIARKIQAADLVLTCTLYNLEYLSKLVTSEQDRLKIHCVYHGIDLNKWIFKGESTITTSQLHLITVGRLVPKKGTIYLLEALIKIKELYPSVHLTIIGDGPEKQKLIRFSEKNLLNKTVTFSGFLSLEDIKSHYNIADLFILPCVIDKNRDRDGLPNVILEAIASGIPVISTYISAIPEVIFHKETGFLISPNNVDEIVDAVKYMIENKIKREEMRKNALNKITASLNLENCTSKLFTLMNTNTFPLG